MNEIESGGSTEAETGGTVSAYNNPTKWESLKCGEVVTADLRDRRWQSDRPTVTIVVDWEEADTIAALLDHDGEDNLLEHVRYCQREALKEQTDRGQEG